MTVYHLEPFQDYLHRCVELNRVHNPDDPVHPVILAQAAIRETGGTLGEPDPASLEGRAVQARRALVAIHRDFPGSSPPWEQAAYLLRGFTGLRPFPDANFRTGWDYTLGLLGHHGHDVRDERADVEWLHDRLWGRIEAAFPGGLRRGDLLGRDETLLELADWFQRRIAVLPRTRQA